MLHLRQLERLCNALVDQTSDVKREIIALLDQVFPEYEEMFSDVFGASSTEILLKYPFPEDLLTIDTDQLAELLYRVSKGRNGE